MAVTAGAGIVTPALTLLGIVTQGETPSADELTQGVLYLNSMFASFNADDLTALPVNVTGLWPSGSSVQALGSGAGAFTGYTGPAPKRIRGAWIQLNGRTIKLEIRTLEWYNNLAYPGLTATGPTDLMYTIIGDDSSATGSVNVWPVPTTSPTLPVTITFAYPFPLAVNAASSLTMSQMALQAAIYNLAANVGPAFGVTVAPEIKKEAADSLARLRNYSASTYNQDPNPPQGQALQPPAQATP